MKRSLIVLVGAIFVFAGVALAAQLTTSKKYKNFSTGERDYIQAQLFRCDISGSLTGTDIPLAGETCASGDHSAPVDCRGYSQVTIHYYEYGTGSGEAKLWNCLNPVGSPAQGIDIPGFNAPVTATTAGVPDTLCIDVTAAQGLTIIGTTAGTQQATISDIGLNFLVGEIQDCTGNCDSTYEILCTKG